MNNIDDYVLGPRTIEGRRVAESFATGEIIAYDPREYQRAPIVYRGKPVYSRNDVHDLERFAQILNARELALKNRQ